MMFRTAALFLMTACPLAQGFGVVPPPTATRSSMMASPSVLMAGTEGNDEPGFTAEDSEMYGFNDSVDMDYDDLYEPDETTEAPVVNEFSSKAKDAFKDAAGKIEDFANDERVQEIASKAGDFAKDVLGQVFGKVGEKLKEIKKEKEEREKQES